MARFSLYYQKICDICGFRKNLKSFVELSYNEENELKTFSMTMSHVLISDYNAFILLIFHIDATNTRNCLCHMVNDSPECYANSRMKWVVAGEPVHLCLFATKYIPEIIEIRYFVYI